MTRDYVKVSVDRLIQVRKGESVRITMEARKSSMKCEMAEELDALETLVRRQMKKHIMRETARGSVPKRTPKPR